MMGLSDLVYRQNHPPVIWQQYRRTNIAEMTPWVPGMDMICVSVSEIDKKLGSPKLGDMIARNPNCHEDKWLVAREYFEENFEPLSASSGKTLHNSDINGARKNVKDIQVFGDGDMFKLLCKASSEKEGWMKSTKAMETATGCVVQVTTQQRNPDGSYAVAEAVTFVPGVCIWEWPDGTRTLIEKAI
jgi:hypothetical protein